MNFEGGATQRCARVAKGILSPIGRGLISPRLLIPFLVLTLIASSIAPSLAQRRRPLLRPAARDYFAGKFVLIPRDERPPSLQQPRMIAQIADHDLITPPARLMGDAEELVAWARGVDYSGVKGVIVSLDSIGDAIGRRSELIEWIRKASPDVPVYGFAFSNTPNAAISSLDYALANGETGQANKVGAESEPDAASVTLVARLLNHRFGLTPKFLPLYSSAAGRDAVHRTISDRIKLLGAGESSLLNEAERGITILLFVHAPQTNDQERAALVESLAAAVGKSYRVALLDLSESKAGKVALLAELRGRKLLDQIIAYASSEAAPDASSKVRATARVLAHSSALLTAIRFLRDDVDRVKRIDRSHVNLLFSRYLTDWAYALEVRPKLETFVRDQLKADPNRLGGDAERAEDFAQREIRAIADELFRDQFKDHLHAILLKSGERAQFELSFVQTLRLRLPSQKVSEVEITPAVYLIYTGNLQQ